VRVLTAARWPTIARGRGEAERARGRDLAEVAPPRYARELADMLCKDIEKVATAAAAATAAVCLSDCSPALAIAQEHGTVEVALESAEELIRRNTGTAAWRAPMLLLSRVTAAQTICNTQRRRSAALCCIWWVLTGCGAAAERAFCLHACRALPCTTSLNPSALTSCGGGERRSDLRTLHRLMPAPPRSCAGHCRR
jgi:hypothetical protein